MCHFARDLGMFRYATYLNFFTPGADDVAMSIIDSDGACGTHLNSQQCVVKDAR